MTSSVTIWRVAGPDPLGARQRTVLERRLEIAGEGSERPCRGRKGPDPEGVLSLQFHEGSDLLEHARHGLLIHHGSGNLDWGVLRTLCTDSAHDITDQSGGSRRQLEQFLLSHERGELSAGAAGHHG